MARDVDRDVSASFAGSRRPVIETEVPMGPTSFDDRVGVRFCLRYLMATLLSPTDFRELWNEMEAPLDTWVEAGRRPDPRLALDAKPTRAVTARGIMLLAKLENGDFDPEVIDRIDTDFRNYLHFPRRDVIDWVRRELATKGVVKPDVDDTRERCEADLRRKLGCTFEVHRQELRDALFMVQDGVHAVLARLDRR
jgi:hypothetical protein